MARPDPGATKRGRRTLRHRAVRWGSLTAATATAVLLLLPFMLARPAAAAPLPPLEAAATNRGGTAVELTLDGDSLTMEQMRQVLEADAVRVRLDPAARARMATTREAALELLESGQRIYGWNQGLGPLKDRELTLEEQREFQVRILKSHAAGVGPALPDNVARLVLIIRANAMARATMGVRPEVPERLLELVNRGVTPHIPEIGSLGIGDLQPMAAAGLVAIGGQAPASFQGREGPASEILPAAGIDPEFVLEAGEAIAIVSGSSVVAARFVHGVQRAQHLAYLAEGALALFMEATRAEASSLDARTHSERRIPAQEAVAARLRALVRGSEWMTEEGRRRLGEESPRVQDAVAIRAAPHLFGSVWQALMEAETLLEREANASTSNPLVLPTADGGYEFVMGGNWHGGQMGHAIDDLNAQITDVGVHSQELSARLLSVKWSYGLPPNLAGGQPGLNSGMVQVQTVATALVPEMQARAVPSGTLSRPAKDGQEDHNSMAMASVRNLHANLDRLETVLAVQYLMSAQGIDLIAERMQGLALGDGTARLHATIRRFIDPVAEDRYMTPELEEMTRLVRGQELLSGLTGQYLAAAA